MKEIYQQAIETYGVELQQVVAIEELSELIKAMCKHERDADIFTINGIWDEIVDVSIMLEQLRIIYDLDESIFEDRKNRKLTRLKHRMDQHEQGRDTHEGEL